MVPDHCDTGVLIFYVGARRLSLMRATRGAKRNAEAAAVSALGDQVAELPRFGTLVLPNAADTAEEMWMLRCVSPKFRALVESAGCGSFWAGTFRCSQADLDDEQQKSASQKKGKQQGSASDGLSAALRLAATHGNTQ